MEPRPQVHARGQVHVGVEMALWTAMEQRSKRSGRTGLLDQLLMQMELVNLVVSFGQQMVVTMASIVCIAICAHELSAKTGGRRDAKVFRLHQRDPLDSCLIVHALHIRHGPHAACLCIFVVLTLESVLSSMELKRMINSYVCYCMGVPREFLFSPGACLLSR